MKISCHDAGKRFNRDWIFRNFTYEFSEGNYYAITGPNGSGKSTLLQVIACAVVSSEGKIEYQSKDKKVDADDVYTLLSIAAPYLDVIEEMTLTEFLHFHQTFKIFLPGIDVNAIISIMGLQNSAHKQIRYYSSGMKQRVKLAQAIFSNVPVLLLDEPCTNLDAAGYELYHTLIQNYCKSKLIIVSSNDINEYHFCNKRMNMLDFKTVS